MRGSASASKSSRCAGVHGVAVFGFILVHPSRPDTQHGSTAREVIEGADHVGQQVGVAVAEPVTSMPIWDTFDVVTAIAARICQPSKWASPADPYSGGKKWSHVHRLSTRVHRRPASPPAGRPWSCSADEFERRFSPSMSSMPRWGHPRYSVGDGNWHMTDRPKLSLYLRNFSDDPNPD